MAQPTITNLSPASAVAGAGLFTLTVTGTGFSNDVVIYFGTTALTTTFVSSTEATAAVAAALVASGPGSLVTARTGGSTSIAVSFVVTSPLDLTTLSSVKAWLSANGLPSTNTTDDLNMQLVITAAGFEWLWRTGNAPADGSVPTASPFVEPVSFNEWYDGPGGVRMFLKHAPINTVSLLQVNGVAFARSTQFGMAGFVIHEDGRSLAIRSGGGNSGLSTGFYLSGFGHSFAKGVQNINVQYTAGYSATPPDIELEVIEMCGVGLKRRGWIDQQSQAMANGAGTIRFRDWELPPRVLRVMTNYTRMAAV